MAEINLPSVAVKRRRTRPYDTDRSTTPTAISALLALTPPPGALVPTLSQDDPGEGWKLCDGQALSKADFPRLYGVLGGAFGEDADTFSLPDLRGRILMGAGGDGPAFRALAGAASITLGVDQLPAHDHAVSDPGHVHAIKDPGHTHAVTDPGHTHSAAESAGTPDVASGGDETSATTGATGSATTGVEVESASTGVSMHTAETGITVEDTGDGEAIDITPPVIGINWLVRT